VVDIILLEGTHSYITIDHNNQIVEHRKHDILLYLVVAFA